MNFFERAVYFLQVEMNRPSPFGWFHLMWIGLTVVVLFILYRLRNKYDEKQLKIVLAIYGIIAFLLELAKQIIWSFEYDIATGISTWDYQWYAAPFQLCTTPIFITIICLFMKKNKLRTSLLSYLSFITILGGITTILLPDSCFVETTIVNIHTMWLHCGSLVISIYLLITKEVELKFENLKNAIVVFMFFVFFAEILNIGIYNSGLLNGEEFNMFYISPYFISHLPVYNTVQQAVPFPIYLLFYIVSIVLGGALIYGISYSIMKIKSLLIKKTDMI